MKDRVVICWSRKTNLVTMAVGPMTLDEAVEFVAKKRNSHYLWDFAVTQIVLPEHFV